MARTSQKRHLTRIAPCRYILQHGTEIIHLVETILGARTARLVSVRSTAYRYHPVLPSQRFTAS